MEVAAARSALRTLLLITACIMTAVHIGVAAIKVHVDLDKAFDFRQVRTWAWAVPTAGHVMAARTPTDDPDAIQQLAEPVIMSAVIAELPGRGLSHTIENPDVTLKYYLLLTMGESAQAIGQFLPPAYQWGMPPFLPSTQSLKIINQGSLAIDVFAKDQVVWRGIAAAEIKPGATQDRRAALIRQAVRDILKKYPRTK